MQNLGATAERSMGQATAATGRFSGALKSVGEVAAAAGRNVAAAGASMQATGASMQAAGSKISSAGSAIGKLAVPLAAAGSAALFMQMKFGEAMDQVHTQAGYSVDDINRLSKAVLDAAPGLARTPKDLADGLYHIASVGIPAAQAMEVLKAAAIGANISGATFDDTANALVTTLKNFPNTAGGAAAIMAELNAIVGSGNLRMQDLVDNLGKVVPVSKSFGLTLKDVGAAIDVMTSRGVGAAQAATMLKMAIATMGAPGDKAASALASIGLSSKQLAEDMRKPNGLLVAVTDLKQHLTDSGKTAVEQAQVLSQAFGAGKTSSGILILTQNLGDLEKIYGKIPEGAAGLKQLLEAQASWEKTSAGQFAHVKAAISTVAVEMGQQLVPIVIPILQDDGKGCHGGRERVSGVAEAGEGHRGRSGWDHDRGVSGVEGFWGDDDCDWWDGGHGREVAGGFWEGAGCCRCCCGSRKALLPAAEVLPAAGATGARRLAGAGDPRERLLSLPVLRLPPSSLKRSRPTPDPKPAIASRRISWIA